ncbi:MAG: Eco57I restriction-modification methylase domain-containing protein [Nitrospira sp.]|nr:Eco57I restriction-modification methylase domain-containing protein [Nitrospira sp.]
MEEVKILPSIATQGIQLQLMAPSSRPSPVTVIEPKGVVYTKQWVVELLLDLSGYTDDRNLVDALAIEPAAGDGAFLGPMIERLLESCRKLGRPLLDCESSLIAYELDETSATLARTLALRILADHGVSPSIAERLVRAWVATQDYLFDASTREADFIIGNPPYVRMEDIPEETASLYRSAYPTMYGRADLYVAFFEAALRQLKVNGVCSFICADRWMRNQYGTELRRLITSAYSLELLLNMHKVNAFENEVDAYPAITVIRHRKQQPAVVAMVEPEAETVQPAQLLTTLLGKNHDARSTLPQGIHVARVNTWFKGSDPWPCHSPEQLALLRRLEDEFPRLETNAKVGIGVATGNDSVYITADESLVEGSRLLKLALAKDVTGGRLEWSGHYLVNPWNADGLVDLEAYPKLKTYYEHHAVALKKRHTAGKSPAGWYKTIDRVNLALIAKPKLYIPDIKDVLEPVLDRGETYPHHNLYFIQSDDWDLEVLGGLLMSAVGQFFVESYCVRMRGGYLRFQAQYLRRIRVPAPNDLSEVRSQELRDAFRRRDRQKATEIAYRLYGINSSLMETALGY